MRARNHRLANAWAIFVAQIALLVITWALRSLRKDFGIWVSSTAHNVERLSKDLATLTEWNAAP